MADYLLPTLFLAIGLAISARVAWLRRQRLAVPALLRVTALFALGCGAFLGAVLVMCNP